jgi:casein kinase II subunit alpha
MSSTSDDSISDSSSDKDDGHDHDLAGIVIYRSAIYATAAADRGADWVDLKHFKPIWHSCDTYTIRRKVGRGKFSTVYLAHTASHRQVALKVLVPVDIRCYTKEIKLLQNLRGHENVVELLDLTRDRLTGVFSLVFEWLEIRPWRRLYWRLSMANVRFCMHCLLSGLDYAHSCGIIHRDIKPDNFGIDIGAHRCRLLDWGLAEFYTPGRRANPHAGTRSYMAPEQLLGYPYYSYAIDVWSAGLIFGMMLFKKSLVAHEADNEEQIFATAKLVGGRQFTNLLVVTEIPVKEEWATRLRAITDIGLLKFIDDANPEFKTPEAIDLLQKMLKTDFRFRITAKAALSHPFFNPDGLSE